MNGASVVASLPLTSPLITPSTGEAEPRGSSCVLYDTYNTFRTIHIRNVLNATNEWASVVCGKVQVVQSIFLPFPLSVYPWREDPTSVASLPLTSPLIMPSTGEAEPRGSSCVLYDTYNTFCILLRLENPKIGRVDDAEIVGDRITEGGPVFWYLLA